MKSYISDSDIVIHEALEESADYYFSSAFNMKKVKLVDKTIEEDFFKSIYEHIYAMKNDSDDDIYYGIHIHKSLDVNDLYDLVKKLNYEHNIETYVTKEYYSYNIYGSTRNKDDLINFLGDKSKYIFYRLKKVNYDFDLLRPFDKISDNIGTLIDDIPGKLDSDIFEILPSKKSSYNNIINSPCCSIFNIVLRSMLDIYEYCVDNYFEITRSFTAKNWKVYNLYLKILRKIVFYEKCIKDEWIFKRFLNVTLRAVPISKRRFFNIINREIYDNYDIIKYNIA